MKYYPESKLIYQNSVSKFTTLRSMEEAEYSGIILEGRAIKCDTDHNLHVKVGSVTGIIPRTECAIGIADGSTKDVAIISRVNKYVQFKVTGFKLSPGKEGWVPIFSRVAAQEECIREYVSKLYPGDIVTGVVTHISNFGVFIDIGCGVTGLLPISNMSVSRVAHPSARFITGDTLRVIVKSIDESGRITFSHKELLGTWEQNAADFEAGQTVPGVVRSVEDYGVFIELAPNLTGLAEWAPGVRVGSCASVYIRSIIPEQMKVKLILVDAFDADYVPEPEKYYISEDVTHIDRWLYSPEGSSKCIYTNFNSEGN